MQTKKIEIKTVQYIYPVKTCWLMQSAAGAAPARRALHPVTRDRQLVSEAA